MKKGRLTVALTTLVLLLFGCRQPNSVQQTDSTNTSSSTQVTAVKKTQQTETKYGSYDENDFDDSYDESAATKITLNNTSAAIDGTGADVKDGILTITAGGTYVLKGEFKGQVKINANDEDVHLVLNNATITNETSSAIYVEQAKKVVATLVNGTKNTLTDGANYSFANAGETEPDAVFFSKDDLTINGSGALTVIGNYSNGIRSKDDLVITAGTINVTAKNNALKGKDSVSIAAGDFTLKTTEGDGIQANNAEETDKGWVAIDGGTFSIESGNDGVQAETNLSIATAKMTIKTAGGYSDQSVDTTASYKGLKASGNILIDDGTFSINTADDAVHSNAAVTINNGKLTIDTGDDGMHADTDLLINNGQITVNNSYEGLEGATVTIKDGTIAVKAADDGINAAGGSDGAATEGAFGADAFGEPGGDSTKFIEIASGTTYVAAEGDGVDSNGDIRMTGGTLVVNGPVSEGNGALDYDGAFTIDGGVFVASGSSGMAMSASDSSSQASVSLYFDETQKADTLINFKNAAGETIVSIAPKKEFSHLAVSSPNLKVGDTVTVATGGTDDGSEQNGLYTNGSYTDGTKLTQISIAEILTSVDQTGAQVSANQMGGGQPPM
ncbi:carbohydrate-binding domain-containing protein [Erwinia sp. CPCC 100877]|nr:carbohydrate-binding domain-containing protein [Erwinia sp. CPCC 100877]